MNNMKLLFDFFYFLSKKLKLEISLKTMKQEHSFAVMNLFQPKKNSKKQFAFSRLASFRHLYL